MACVGFEEAKKAYSQVYSKPVPSLQDIDLFPSAAAFKAMYGFERGCRSPDNGAAMSRDVAVCSLTGATKSVAGSLYDTAHSGQDSSRDERYNLVGSAIEQVRHLYNLQYGDKTSYTPAFTKANETMTTMEGNWEVMDMYE